MTAYDLKLTPRKNLNADQRAIWDAAYGPKNEAFKRLNLQGRDLVRWKYQRYMKDYLRCIASVGLNAGAWMLEARGGIFESSTRRCRARGTTVAPEHQQPVLQ